METLNFEIIEICIDEIFSSYKHDNKYFLNDEYTQWFYLTNDKIIIESIAYVPLNEINDNTVPKIYSFDIPKNIDEFIECLKLSNYFEYYRHIDENDTIEFINEFKEMYNFFCNNELKLKAYKKHKESVSLDCDLFFKKVESLFK